MIKTKKKMKYKVSRPFIPKWKLYRSSDPLLSVFMWGINHTISELNNQAPARLLMPDDFKSFSKIRIDNHLFNKESMPSHFKVKEYCPIVFKSLREKFGVDEPDFLKSLTKHEPLPMESSGRSNARLYMSYNERYVIKTIYAEEVAEVHSILQKYHNYIVEKRAKTLLPQYLGMYRLTVEGNEVYAVVMRNIFCRKYSIKKKFDLKGSTVQRQATEKEKAKEFPTYKDNDFLDEKIKLYLSKEYRDKLVDMITSDTDFLANLNLMDYSLLVGIHERDSVQAENEPSSFKMETTTRRSLSCPIDSSDVDNGTDDSNEFSSQPTPPASPRLAANAFAPFTLSEEFSGLQLQDEFYAVPSRADAPNKYIYFIGLIDILTYYGMKKITATAAKTVKYGAEAEISTVRPQQYAKRLVDFILRALDTGAGDDVTVANLQTRVELPDTSSS